MDSRRLCNWTLKSVVTVTDGNAKEIFKRSWERKCKCNTTFPQFFPLE